MPISLRSLNRATLARQLLLERAAHAVPEAVQRIAGIQAQEPASPYIALWNRLVDFAPEELDAAFRDGDVVKASLMRLTLHAVHRSQYAHVHTAMLPSLRASRLADRRYLQDGLAPAEADDALPMVLGFLQQPRSGTEVEEHLIAHLGERAKRVWWALRTYAPLHRASTGGPWSFGARPAYVAAEPPSPIAHGDAVQMLLLDYLRAFGPASMADFGQFTLLRRPVVARAVEALGGRLVKLEGPSSPLLDVPGAPLPGEGTAAPPRLLPMWDSILFAYADRSRIIPPEYRPHVIRRNGNTLATLLVDGYVAGVWRPAEGGIEATAFQPLSEEVWQALAHEARALSGFLGGREEAVYRQYDKWWKDLPAQEVRVLGAMARK